jgi:hypothetical protein
MTRRIFGWDLPPGVSARDLPGNTPADQEAEAFYDAFYEMEEKARKLHPELGDNYVEELATWVWKQMGEAYGQGYEKGIDDEALARRHPEGE